MCFTLELLLRILRDNFLHEKLNEYWFGFGLHLARFWKFSKMFDYIGIQKAYEISYQK